MSFRVIGSVDDVGIIAIGHSIRELHRLHKIYGKGRWRKLKGIASVEWSDKTTSKVELHWYEAPGIGKKEFKIKRILED